MSTTIEIRRDTAANWTSVSPILAPGEIGFETDTRKMKIGDGATAWTVLAYGPLIPAAALAAEVWASFTPTAYQTALLTLSQAAGYQRHYGKLVVVTINITVNCADTAGTAIVISGLPAFLGRGVAGFGQYYDASTTLLYQVLAMPKTATSIYLYAASSTVAAALGQVPSIAVGVGDTIALTLAYEAA